MCTDCACVYACIPIRRLVHAYYPTFNPPLLYVRACDTRHLHTHIHAYSHVDKRKLSILFVTHIHTHPHIAVAYPGFQREGYLSSGPIQKCGGGGGGASGPIYEKWGGGGGIPLQVRYLWAHRKYLHVPT